MGSSCRPGTSPPVLERIPGWRGPAKRVDPALDPVRGVLRLLGPATPKQVAGYLDAPVKDVKAHWPEDVQTVTVEGEERSILAANVDALRDPPDVSGVVQAARPVRPVPAVPRPRAAGAREG